MLNSEDVLTIQRSPFWIDDFFLQQLLQFTLKKTMRVIMNAILLKRHWSVLKVISSFAERTGVFTRGGGPQAAPR